MSARATDDLFRAEVLAPLKAELAVAQGRLNEQGAALSSAARDTEHAQAKHRRAERQATEATPSEGNGAGRAPLPNQPAQSPREDSDVCKTI